MDKLCKICDKTFSKPYNYRRHMLEKHNEIIDPVWKKLSPKVSSLVPIAQLVPPTASIAPPIDPPTPPPTVPPIAPNPSKEESGVMKDYIITTLPVILRNKGHLLFQQLKRSGKVSKDGQLISNGEILLDTNVIDLINDVLRRRKTSPPEGWNEFAHVLEELNISKHFIGNERYKPKCRQRQKVEAGDVQGTHTQVLLAESSTDDSTSSDESDDSNEDALLKIIHKTKERLDNPTRDELLSEFKLEYERILTEIILPLERSSYHQEFMDKIVKLKRKYREAVAVRKVLNKNTKLLEEIIEMYDSSNSENISDDSSEDISDDSSEDISDESSEDISDDSSEDISDDSSEDISDDSIEDITDDSNDSNDSDENGMLNIIDSIKANSDDLLKEFKLEYQRLLTETILPLERSSYHNEFMDKIVQVKRKYREDVAVRKVLNKNTQLLQEIMDLYESNSADNDIN